MAVRENKVRMTFTLTAENAVWVSEWLKERGAPPVMFSAIVDDFVKSLKNVLEEMDKKTGGRVSIGDLFMITGKAINDLESIHEEPPLL